MARDESREDGSHDGDARGVTQVLGFASMRLTLLASVVLTAQIPMLSASVPQGRAGAAGDCVTIDTPKPTASYVIQHSESTGKTTTVTQVWESMTETGSRMKWTGPAGNWIQVTEHRIVDDVSVLDRTSKLDLNGALTEATTFRPGIVGEPTFRACTGRTWQIRAVTALFQSGTLKVTQQTPAGSLRVVAIRERVTVPAGTFDAVHYVRTSQYADDYWKSIEHGVVVKHIGKVNGVTITETLTAIK